MTKTDKNSGFYQPDTKEIALGVCLVLEQAGGCLSQARVVELVGEQFHIPESQWRLPRWNASSKETVGAYFTGWAATWLRNEGFVARNSGQTRGMCILTGHGRELGQWAMRIYTGENPLLPDWVEAFFEPVRTRIKNLLTGGKRRRPPDYEICRWVRYCYLLNWPEQGVALFSRVLADNVEESLYRHAERQARIMRGRLEERPTQAEPTPSDENARTASGGVRADLRKWAIRQYPVGARIPTLGGDTYHEIQGYKRAGILVYSAMAMQERIVQWDNVACFLLRLCKARELTLQGIGADGDFLCSLLARLTGAVIDPEKCAVRLVDDKLWNLFD